MIASMSYTVGSAARRPAAFLAPIPMSCGL